MSGKMKRLRRTNNPLDRNTRNDINYNWDVLDATLSQIDTSDFETDNRFKNVESDIKKLEEMDDHLSSRIQKNRDDIDAMNLDLLIEQGNVAERKGQTAKKQGDKAEEQGNTAKKQGNKSEEQGNTAESQGDVAEKKGNYAKEQGDYAKEKAEYAAKTTSEIIEANEDLAQTKLEAVQATQKANKSAEHAQQAGDKAEEQIKRVQPIIDRSETALDDVELATEHATNQGDYAKKQGDYAKDTADKVNAAHDDLSKLKDDTVQATDDAISATLDALDATDKATQMAEFANTEGERAKERTDYLESLLPNIEGWEFKGGYSDVDYDKHNIVTYNGSTYILMADQSTGNPLQDDNWHMLAQRGVDGEGSVQTVNNISPDLKGNVDLGVLATPDDVDDAADKTLEASKEYTDAQIKAIPEIDLSPYATTKNTEEQIAKAKNEAKQYTDEKLGDVDLSEMEQKLNDHANKLATENTPGHVSVGNGLIVDSDGELSIGDIADKVEEAFDNIVGSVELGDPSRNYMGTGIKPIKLEDGSVGMVKAHQVSYKDKASVQMDVFIGAKFREGIEDGRGFVKAIDPTIKFRIVTPIEHEIGWVNNGISSGWIDISGASNDEMADIIKDQLSNHVDKLATKDTPGHVILSDKIDDDRDVNSFTAATPKAVKKVYDDLIGNVNFLVDKIDDLNIRIFRLKPEDIGLVSASQSEAEDGTNNDVYMTPLRTKEHVDKRLSDSVTSSSTTNIASSYAVKRAYDRASEALTLGDKQRKRLADSLSSKGVSLPSSPSWDRLQSEVEKLDVGGGGDVKKAVVSVKEGQKEIFIGFVPDVIEVVTSHWRFFVASSKNQLIFQDVVSNDVQKINTDSSSGAFMKLSKPSPCVFELTVYSGLN